MATEYLIEGVDTFASTSWLLADGTAASPTAGFKNQAELVVPGGGTSITGGLDWSALTTGITYLKIAERFSGNIGSGSAPLKVDADYTATQYTSAATSSSRIEHYGAGTLYLQGGGSGVITNLFQYGVGRSVLQGSTTATYATITNGLLTIENAATLTNGYLLGGSATIGTNTSSAGTLLSVVAGSHQCARPYTTINLYGGSLILNCKQAGAASSINVFGGNLVLLAHGNTAITSITQWGGMVDISQLRVDTTVTTWNRYRGAMVTERPKGAALTITNDVRFDPTITAI